MDVTTFWPNYFLLLIVIVFAGFGAWWGITRLRDLHQQTPVLDEDTVNPTVESDTEPEPAPKRIVIAPEPKPVSPCRWHRVRTKNHGMRQRPLPC